MRYLAALLVALLAGCSSGHEDPPRMVDVGYFVTGTAESVSITLSDGSGGTQQADNRDVPLVTDDGPGLHYRMTSGAFAYISAQNEGERGTVACRITVDGVTVKEAESDGGYTIASCSATVP